MRHKRELSYRNAAKETAIGPARCTDRASSLQVAEEAGLSWSDLYDGKPQSNGRSIQIVPFNSRGDLWSIVAS
jgi:hypothetical protein